MSLKPVVAIIGATATGKTKLGVAVAKMLCGEVVGLDSLQCYRHGGVVTARPMEGEMEGVPHHMVGCMEPTEEPQTEEYVGRVLRTLDDMDRRSRTPVLVGGSTSLTLPVLEAVSKQGYRLLVLLLWSANADDGHVKRICDRVDEMVEELGLLEELAGLESLQRELGLAGADRQGGQPGVWKAIGYPELLPYLRSSGDGDEERAVLLQAGLRAMKDNTVQYALQQGAWAREALIPALFQHGTPFTVLPLPSQAKEWEAEVGRPGLRRAFDFCASLATRISRGPEATRAEQRVVCVFAGSQPGCSPAHAEAARALARAFHQHDMHMVYGGGTTGIMGAVAGELARLSGPDAVHGVIPYALDRYEARALGQTAARRSPGAAYGRKTVVPDMHARKQLMHDCVARGAPGSGFVALSGGYGTSEELLEAATWKQLGIHDKPVCVYNVDGFYDELLAWVSQGVGQGFIPSGDAAILGCATSASEVVEWMLKSDKKGSGHGIIDWA